MFRALGAILLIAVTGLALVACASGTQTSAPNPRDRALLASVMRGMKTNLSSVTIGKPGREWGARPRLQFLYVTPSTTSTVGKIEDNWYGTLIAGAYEAQCGTRADCLVGYSVRGVGGSRLRTSRTRLPSVSSRALASEIRVRFARQGLHVTKLSFERPWGLAPVITVTALHPQRAVTAFYKSALLIRLPIEGFLVRMVDRNGIVFLIDGGSFRTKEGSGWMRPSLRVPNRLEKVAP